MEIEAIGLAFGLMAAITLGIALTGIFGPRADREAVRLWAAAHGYELLYVERVKTPRVEKWAAAEGFEFYFISTFQAGKVRRAWLRCPKNENADAGDCDVAWIKSESPTAAGAA